MEYISAGDIEKYSYCPLSWWLSRGEKNRDSEGVRKHREIGEMARKGMMKVREERESERGVIYLAMGGTFIALIGISMLYSSYPLAITFHAISIFWLMVALYLLWRSDYLIPRWKKLNFERIMIMLPTGSMLASIFAVSFLFENHILGYLLEIISLLWLIGATFFFYICLKSEMEYSSIRKELKLPDGEIIYVDDLKSSPILKSQKYGIWGRPDILIKVGDDYIPVEIKTGRIPKGPLFSHIMQLTAYMLLVEENYRTPPYGLLKYGPYVYRIDYEEDLKKILLKKVEEMRRALKTGEVHRNHNRVGKCLHCSRRDICPERLA